MKLIMFCVSSSSLIVLWNRVKLPSFAPRRGLRQWDPLFPYLFMICMEGLNYLISRQVEGGV